MTDLSRYYNRFDPSKNFEKVMFLAGRNLQAAELNEIQDTALSRIRSVSDALFKDGDIVRDASLRVDPVTGVTTCQSGAVYLAGAVRGVPTATITIPVNDIVVVGLYMVTSVVTELDDATLRDPAVGARNVGNPGAYRQKIECYWGYAGDGQSGEFYPIFTVENGVLRAKEPPPNLDAVTQALARYDRDSAGGSYVVSGMTVNKAADAGTDQVYTVSEGRARVNGFGIELATSRRVVYTTTADLLPIASEPHASSSAASQRINLNHTPVDSVTRVSITRRHTASVVHAGYSGSIDPLPNTSIVQIVAVNQGGAVNGTGDGFTGGTTYVKGTDYKLTTDEVDWSLPGAEIAPGSTYQVIYDCIETVAPDSVDSTGLNITGAVAGTTILVDYNEKLPRIDRLCMDADGNMIWLKGVAASYNPQPPSVPAALLALATVYQSWDAKCTVTNDGVRVVPMSEIAGIQSRLDNMAAMIAQNTLKTDAQNRDTALKKGMFVDPFYTDDLRDQGISQTAAVVNGVLTLPISGTASQMGADVAKPVALAYTLETALEQTARTGSMTVNPYMAFAPVPAAVVLTPAVDRWTDVQTTWLSDVTERYVVGQGDQSSLSTSTFDTIVGRTTTNLETLRQISVRFSITGFGPNEQLSSVTFDGIAVIPTP